MPWGVAAAAVASAAAGALSGSKSSKTSSTQTSEPWGPQQQYLTSGFGSAQDALKNALGLPAYSGSFTAPFSADQTNAMNLIRGYSTGAGQSLADQVTQAGAQGLGANDNYITNANTIFNQAGGDPTGTTLARANQYANNPYLQGQIDSAIGDVNRGLGINVANLNANAAGDGSQNSSRTGLVESALRRDALKQAGDISTTMRSGQFNNGLDLAANQMAQSDANRLAANQQLSGGANNALDFANTGYNMTTNNLNALLGIGNQQQQQGQQEIQGQLNKDQYDSNRAMDLIGKYMSIVSGNYGGTQSGSSTTPGIGAGAGALGGALSGLGAAGQLGWRPFGQTQQTDAGLNFYAGLR